MSARVPEPVVRTIEGRRTLVVERHPPLPRRLGELLAHLHVYPVKITGWRESCGAQNHRLLPFARGPYRGPDGETRDLRLEMCADCEAVCVRDVSMDSLDRLPTGGQKLRRRNLTLGWYSGARRAQRTYT